MFLSDSKETILSVIQKKILIHQTDSNYPSGQTTDSRKNVFQLIETPHTKKYAYGIHVTCITEWFPVRQAVPPCVQISVQWSSVLWLTRSVGPFSKEELTKWNWLHLEKQIFLQIAKQFPHFMETTVFATTRHFHLRLCQINPVHAILSPVYLGLFLDAFAKLRKVTLSFAILSFCPRGTPSASTGRIFMRFDIWLYFKSMSVKFEFN